MADPVELCRTMLVGTDPAPVVAVRAVVGTRAYRSDAVPSQAPRPLLQLTLVSAVEDIDLDGTLDDTLATVKIDAVGDGTPAGAAAVAAAIDAIRGIGALEIAPTDTGDEPGGPVDQQGRTAFVRSITAQFTF